MATSLKAMAADKTNRSVKKTDLYPVDPRVLKEMPGFNLRNYDDPDVQEHINSFAHAYSTGQYVPPLLVWVNADGEIIIVEGHCRRRGALKAIEEGAELAYVPCVQFKGSEAERISIMLKSAEGKPLKPLEVASGYLRLSRMGHSPSDIATKMRKSVSHVEQMLMLATAEQDVHDMVKQGLVSATMAIEVIREHGERAGAFLMQKLQSAQKSGKTKVTRTAINGRALPRKVVNTVVSSVETFASKLDTKTRSKLAEYEGLEPEQLAGKKVEIDAAALLEILRANNAMEEARAAKARADAEQAEKNKQMDIEDQQSEQ